MKHININKNRSFFTKSILFCLQITLILSALGTTFPLIKSAAIELPLQCNGALSGLSASDIAKCKTSPKLTNEVNPLNITSGDTVTYTLKITNSDPLKNLIGGLQDVLSNNSKYEAGSITYSNFISNGVVNNYADTDSLTITNYSIAPLQTATVNISVKTDYATPISKIYNQAKLTGLDTIYGDILSDFPSSPADRDPTPLSITAIGKLPVVTDLTDCSNSNVLKLDLVIVLDSSGSIGTSTFYDYTNSTANIISNSNIIPQNGSVRLTLIQFSDYSYIEIPPTIITSSNINSLKSKIQSINYISSGTNTHVAIDEATRVLKSTTPTAINRVVMLATDGQPNYQNAFLDSAENMEKSGVVDALNIIGISSISDDFNMKAAVFPQPFDDTKGFYRKADTFADYSNIFKDAAQSVIKTSICIGSISLNKVGTFVDTNNDGSAQAGEKINYTFEVKNNGNVPLTNVMITDTFPGVTVFGGPINLAVGAIDNSSFTATYTITDEDITTKNVINQATVSGLAPGNKIIKADSNDPNTSNQYDKTEVPLIVNVPAAPAPISNNKSITPFELIIADAPKIEPLKSTTPVVTSKVGDKVSNEPTKKDEPKLVTLIRTGGFSYNYLIGFVAILLFCLLSRRFIAKKHL